MKYYCEITYHILVDHVSLCLELIEETKQDLQLARRLIGTIVEVAPDVIAKLLGIELILNEIKKLREDF